ncbi:SET and MYND domain-containing protein DDB_G0277331 [Durusdinium trenchii]|uniref:SET and MYND domain-containing protein DDB_G0277331 n=1 Tax=Durusdinium trenchii TaxID=1381693 RepID=A0ABP0HKC4_9DINO
MAEQVRAGLAAVRRLQRQDAAARWWFQEDLKYRETPPLAGAPGRVACSWAPCESRTVREPALEEEEEEEEEEGRGVGEGGGGDGGLGEGDEPQTRPEKETRTRAQEGQPEAKVMRCGKCGAAYCGRACQVAAWKSGAHKVECKRVQEPAAHSKEIVEEMLRRIRMYLCPYAVAFQEIRGRGFVFLRSNAALQDWIYEHPIDAQGRLLDRHVKLQFLTMGEFDALAFEDDFELAAVRPSLVEALEAYDDQAELPVVLVLRCGFFALVTVPLVPEMAICKGLANMYKYAEMQGPLQLNVDDV